MQPAQLTLRASPRRSLFRRPVRDALELVVHVRLCVPRPALWLSSTWIGVTRAAARCCAMFLFKRGRALVRRPRGLLLLLLLLLLLRGAHSAVINRHINHRDDVLLVINARGQLRLPPGASRCSLSLPKPWPFCDSGGNIVTPGGGGYPLSVRDDGWRPFLKLS